MRTDESSVLRSEPRLRCKTSREISDMSLSRCMKQNKTKLYPKMYKKLASNILKIRMRNDSVDENQLKNTGLQEKNGMLHDILFLMNTFWYECVNH